MRSLLLLIASLLFAADAGANWTTFFSPSLKRVEREISETQQKLDALGTPVIGQTVQNLGCLDYGTKSDPTKPRWVELDLGAPYEIDTVTLVPVQIDWHQVEFPDFGFPKLFQIDISEDAKFSKFTTVANHTAAEFPDPGVAPVTFQAHKRKARYIRLKVMAPKAFALAELMVMVGNYNVAIGSSVMTSNQPTIVPRWTPGNLVDGYSPLGPPVLRAILPYEGFFAGPPPADSVEYIWMGLDLKNEFVVDEVRLHPIHARLTTDMPGYGFPTRFRVEFSDTPDFQTPTSVLDYGGMDFPNPGNNPVTIRTGGKTARYVRMLMIQPAGSIHPKRFGLSEIEVYSGNVNVARGAEAIGTSDPTPKTNKWPKDRLVDGYTSFGRLMELPDWLDNWTQRRELQTKLKGLKAEQAALIASAVSKAQWLGGGLGATLVVTTASLLLISRRRRNREMEQFRKQLAQDLHDEVGSNLAAIGLIGDAAETSKIPVGPDVWKTVVQIARETTTAMRETLWLAGSKVETSIDLIAHLRSTAERMLPGRNVQWVSDTESFPMTWSQESRRQLFLFFKEALANVIRHSNADAVVCNASFQEDSFRLEIQDNGKGFDPNSAKHGIGLNSLRDRAKKLGGTVEIITAPDKGVRVILSGRNRG